MQEKEADNSLVFVADFSFEKYDFKAELAEIHERQQKQINYEVDEIMYKTALRRYEGIPRSFRWMFTKPEKPVCPF